MCGGALAPLPLCTPSSTMDCFGDFLPLKFLETKKWSIAVWAAYVKKNNFFSIFSFGRVNYIFHKLSVNTKHAQF